MKECKIDTRFGGGYLVWDREENVDYLTDNFYIDYKWKQ